MTRSFWIIWVQSESSSVLLTDGGDGGHGNTEAEIVVMQPQANECLGPPEARRGRKDPL